MELLPKSFSRRGHRHHKSNNKRSLSSSSSSTVTKENTSSLPSCNERKVQNLATAAAIFVMCIANFLLLRSVNLDATNRSLSYHDDVPMIGPRRALPGDRYYSYESHHKYTMNVNLNVKRGMNVFHSFSDSNICLLLFVGDRTNRCHEGANETKYLYTMEGKHINKRIVKAMLPYYNREVAKKSIYQNNGRYKK